MCLFLGTIAQKDLRGLGTRSSSEAKGKAETESKDGGSRGSAGEYQADERAGVARPKKESK